MPDITYAINNLTAQELVQVLGRNVRGPVQSDLWQTVQQIRDDDADV